MGHVQTLSSPTDVQLRDIEDEGEDKYKCYCCNIYSPDRAALGIAGRPTRTK